MKKQKKYSSQEEQESYSVNELDAIYISQKNNGITDVRMKPDWSTFPGQFTEEEKQERLQKAMEDTCGYSQDEMREMVASWGR